MNNLVKSSFSLNLTTLRFFGLYPRRNHSVFYLLYGCVLGFFYLIPESVFGILYYLLDENLTLLDAGLNLTVLVGMVCTTMKLLPFIINNKKVRECIYYLQIFNVTLNEKQKDLRDDCIWVCRRNSRLFFVSVVFDNIMWICQPLFSPEHRKFPMEVWLPFDPTTNDAVFYFIYIFIGLGFSYTGLANISADTLICGLIYHASGQIKILEDNLEFIEEYSKETVRQNLGNYEAVKHRVIYRRIRECIRHHLQILCFVQKIESAFSWVVFSQFFGSTGMICVCCLHLSLSETGSSNFLIAATYLATILAQLYFYCYYGATLYEESKILATSVYVGRWYEYDLKSQRALALLMERAKIPMSVTAGKVFDLSLATFTNVLKKSYSLLALLENY